MPNVFANGRSILHKGHGQTQLAVAPDVCKTPSPGGPVPVPYPNFSSDSNLTKGAKSVKINGNPAANTDSQLSRSNGDEAGTAGGIVSSKNMGAFGWPAGSLDVQAEGKSVVRLVDSSLTNGNTYNDTGLNLGETGLFYGDDALCPRTDCEFERDLAQHRLPETQNVAELCAQFVAELETTGPRRVRKPRGAGRMVGVGVCICGQVWRAISGPELPDTSSVSGGGNFCNGVADRPGDDFYTATQALNPDWKCAALKILSGAGSGHKIVALSEKWLGKREGDDPPISKTFSTQDHLFPVSLFGGSVFSALPQSVSDRVEGYPEDVETIPSGGSVPSCGTCQTFLPALICVMVDC